MVWSCKKGNEAEGGVLRLVNEMTRKKESRKTKENLESYSGEGFGSIWSGWECGIWSKKMEEDHRKSDPYVGLT